PYTRFVREEVSRVAGYQDWLLFHDDLAEINVPFYFHEFMKQAARYGLQFLAEADFFEMQDHTYPPEVRERLHEMSGGDIVAREQYLDFLKCRKFRQTLLCHAQVALDRPPKLEWLTRYYVASPARPVVPQPDVHSEEALEFRGRRGAAMSPNLPLAKAAVCILGSVWPLPLRWDELVRRARSWLGQPTPAAGEEGADLPLLAETLLGMY